MEIVPLRPAHHDAAVELWHATRLVSPPNDPRADLAHALAGATSTVLAGTDGDALVATAMAGHDGHRGWVYYLAVLPQLQGRGHGGAMLGRWLDPTVRTP